MAPLPSSRLPGHRALHERALAALERCQEREDIEFKEAAAWLDLRWRITGTVLGMGNLRDGGVVLVGASERGDSWELTGVQDAQLASYDPDIIADQVNAYVSPYVDLDVVLLSHEAQRYVLIGVKEFRETPLVCRKNGPDKSGLIEGRIYLRPPGRPRTTQVQDARELHDLLELAAEKRARRILETSRRIGLSARDKEAAADMYDRELRGL